jgi:hypothetical protein
MEHDAQTPEQPVAREDELNEQAPAGDEESGGTAPPSPTHEATEPPGNPEADEEAVEAGRDRLDQAGGGH